MRLTARFAPILALLWLPCALKAAEPTELQQQFLHDIQPMLKTHCYDCHAGGANEGGLAFDTSTEQELLSNRNLWWNVLKNVRAGLMPPAGEAKPTDDDREQLSKWIYTGVFGIDPSNPDPGRVTVRRLNRTEYRNTIRDLMGIDFNAEVVFPPEDTGFGFDNVGDVLSISPLLMEKYLQSASKIVQEAVPTVCKITPISRINGSEFLNEDGSTKGSRLDCGTPIKISKKFSVETTGTYDLHVNIRSFGSFFFNPTRCKLKLFADGEELYEDEYGWDENKLSEYHFTRELTAGEHEFIFELEPTVLPDAPVEGESGDDDTFVGLGVAHIDVEGPMGVDKWTHPKNYERFFPRDEPPTSQAERREYAQEVLSKFLTRAYRRPADQPTLERLLDLAESVYEMPNKTFEAGISQAMVAILASPRFLFRIENVEANDDSTFPLIDQYALASRLSYFLWSTMPDQELFELAQNGQLRDQLDVQLSRMLRDDKSKAFIENFTGQWLRSRDIEHVSLDPVVVLGFGEEYDSLLASLRQRGGRGRGQPSPYDEELQKVRNRIREIRGQTSKFDNDARQAMQRETEMMFEFIVREDHSLLEVLDSDYVFVNEKLAALYDIPDVKGKEMRRVTLPEGSPRGGLLTQGTMLVVTSNPTRTSPVKRGLFILENVLGLPSPPPPPNVPELEEAAGKFGDREPTLREVLAAHRESALCSSCHSRMDPLGLALENFNALGMWRESEHDQAIDASGELATGETFKSVHELKKILVANHRGEFYRCLTQKLMTYALGRGMEYSDEYAIEEIVQQLDHNDGKFSVLLKSVVTSPAFQRQRRNLPPEAVAGTDISNSH